MQRLSNSVAELVNGAILKKEFVQESVNRHSNLNVTDSLMSQRIGRREERNAIRAAEKVIANGGMGSG